MRSKFKWIFALLLAFSMQFSFAQEKTVTGTVTEAGLPLPGVSVVVKGTTRGTQTDMDGNYSIKAKTGEVLVFSFIGMQDATQTVGAANKINVAMKSATTELENVVVTAVGIKKRQDAITSTNQVVKAKEITQAQNPNIVQSLAGKVSGLQINTTNNGVNATTRIVLRGNRSITGDNQALIVIDNVISSATVLQQLPPEAIQEVNVIKSAQGSALYGEQGVNGVIVVTTKKGTKGGKVVVSVNSAVDFEEVSFIAQRQTRYGQGWNGQHVTYENGGWGAEFDGVVRPVGLAQADGSYIMAPYSPIKDNIKKFFQTGTILQNGVSVNAGDENGYASLTINKQNTDFVVKGDQLDRTSFLFKGGKKLGRWNIDGNVNYITQRTNTTSSALFTELLQAATNIPIEQFEHSGNAGHWTSYYRNPYWMRDNIRNKGRRDFVNGIATINFEINKNINISNVANIQFTQVNTFNYTNEYIDTNQVGGGDHTTVSSFDTSNANQRSIYNDFMVNFDYMLTDNISFKLNTGTNIQDNYVQSTALGGDNLTIPGLYNVTNTTGIPRTANSFSRDRRFSVLANVDLGYKDYLFLNMTGRNDWTSKLHDGEKDNYFYPSAGLSFIPTKAFGMTDNKVLNYAKVSANLTRVGNSSAVGVYGINDLYTSALGYPFGNLSSFTQLQNPTDPKISPEFMTTSEFSAALGFFKDRLTLEGSVYKTTTEDLITRASASNASGLDTVLMNLGKMTTTGFEIDLGFTPIDNKAWGLKWENRLSYSHNKSIVNKVSDQATEVELQNFPGTGIGIFAQEGEEFPLIKGIAYERDDQGRVKIDADSGNPIKTSQYQILGKANPDYIIGYNSAIEFKGVRLAGVFDYRTGHQFWAGTKDWLSWSGHLIESAENGRSGFIFPNSSTDIDGDGVYEANSTVITGGNTYSSYLNYFSNEYRAVAENFVLDATAFKVRELSLSYSIPTKMIEKAGLTSLRFGVNARNPFVVLPKENRKYHDPEFSNTAGNAAGLAVTGQYPATRTFGFNVNLTF
jgi:TonB-linked SusC/RagA family outer membrane protein